MRVLRLPSLVPVHVLALAGGLVGCGAASAPVVPDAAGVVSSDDGGAPSSDDASPPADAAVAFTDGGTRSRHDAAMLDATLGAADLGGGSVDMAGSVADLATGAPVDMSGGAPADLAMAAPVDLAMAGPADMARPPVDMSGAAPVDMAMAGPVDLAMAAPPDLAMRPPADLAMKPPADMATPPPSGDMGYVPPSGSDDPLVHAAPTPISLARLSGTGVLDVGTDEGGGVWAVSTSTVYYWPTSSGSPFTYSAATGLARGSSANPFAAVAGAHAGQAIIGNRGAIADVLQVNPSTGAVQSLQNMSFTCDPKAANYTECTEQLQRVTAGIRIVASTSGTFNGTAYVGGTHGTSAWHGLDGNCGCIQFQQHVHYIPQSGCDSTVPQNGCWSGDAYGLAFTPQGDLWIGDEHFVALLPQGSVGSSADFFQNFTVAVDVFPLVNDEVHALAVDGAGGVWVASFGQGLAYLNPGSYTPSYYDRSRELPMNRLTAVAVDTDGSVWVGTAAGGVARKQGNSWTYYTAASGLPSDDIMAIYIDKRSSPRRVLIATDAGIGIYNGQ